MKKSVKQALHRAKLLPLAEKAYFDLKLASPGLIRREAELRLRGAPDGLPLPESRLVFEVIASHWKAVYYDSGEEIVDDMARVLRDHDVDFRAFESVLDFGCGCGRLIRHVRRYTDAALHGTDYNERLVAWCQANLPIGTFGTNQLAPPLRYDDASFDFIYARSVFTHLPADLISAWMDELVRVLRPGGILYFTMHGRPTLGGLSPAERATFNNDDLVVTYATFAGENLCSTYASQGYVDRRLSDRFDRVAFVEGRGSNPHLRQDVHVMRLR